MIVLYDKNGGPVNVVITVTGLISWGYNFNANGTVTKSDNENGTTVDIPTGQPIENRFDSWEIYLTNVGDNPVTVNASVEYFQGSKSIGVIEYQPINIPADTNIPPLSGSGNLLSSL